METLYAQYPAIRDTTLRMKTYGFGDPNPVADMNRIYPYFRFDTYSEQAEERDWKMVILENEYIKVYVCPEIGGKVWGAIEKSTGREFLYFNDVVKFRDVATRGAWTSGGLEYNFGVIGHSPNGATPVDYALKTNADGSVSCVVGAVDLSSRSKWSVEIRLAKENAFFETHVSWMNLNPAPVSFYHWMNAAAKASGNLEFLYPGSKRIGHGGEVDDWPIDNGRDISRYDNNNFGVYKSYHIINSYSDVFGGYWHDDDFGFGHYAAYDDKPGRKIWIWGLSDQGMIWEDLLTDTKGQYIEYQAGKLFNQAAHSSSATPFKNREFYPYDTERAREIWFPVKATGGMVAASEHAVLNVKRKGREVSLSLSALQPLSADLVIRSAGRVLSTTPLRLSPLQLHKQTFVSDDDAPFQVVLGGHLLVYDSAKETNEVNRPYQPAGEFDWSSAYGCYVKGLELEKQRRYPEAHDAYLQGLRADPLYAPLLGRTALSYFRKADDSTAVSYAAGAMAIDTYDDLANYVYALANQRLGHITEAKSGFSIAAQSPAFRSASYTGLARLYLVEGDLPKALDYTRKALDFNSANMAALELRALAFRLSGDRQNAEGVLQTIYQLDAISEFRLFEQYRWGLTGREEVVKAITNELPAESYLELASRYLSYGRKAETLEILNLAPAHPIVSFWKACLDPAVRREETRRGLGMPTDLVFPHRPETAKMLEALSSEYPHWKINYYLALYHWSVGNSSQARDLFLKCGEQPDEPSFYLSKNRLFQDDTAICESGLRRAAQLAPANWRVGMAQIAFYGKSGKWDSANEQAAALSGQYPERYDVGLAYAKTLLRKGDYEKSLAQLAKLRVLPFEGSTEGRNIYYEACIRSALQRLAKRDYKGAIALANDAKRWPKNIGVGKPYDVDERMENYLLYSAYNGLGDTKAAAGYLQQVAGHKTPAYLNDGSTAYFQLAALKLLGKESELQREITRLTEAAKQNTYVKWALAHFRSPAEAAPIRQALLEQEQVVQAYDTKYVDQAFDLTVDVVEATTAKKVNH